MKLQSRKIVLGETEYEVSEAGHRRAKGWKKAFLDGLFRPLQAQLVELNALDLDAGLTLGDLPTLSPFVTTLLTDYIDQVAELVITYSPVLEENRETILDTASDRQILAAFWEVLQLANPLSPSILAQLSGLARIGTSQNLPSPNGE